MLHRIRKVPTYTCSNCDKKDTIGHRLTDCREGKHFWDWTRQRIARILRTMQERIPNEWLTRPKFALWLPKRHRAILWILAKLVLFRNQQQSDLILQELIDFMKRPKWYMYHSNKASEFLGNYLILIDTETVRSMWANYKKEKGGDCEAATVVPSPLEDVQQKRTTLPQLSTKQERRKRGWRRNNNIE
jgi:hypothetical protein